MKTIIPLVRRETSLGLGFCRAIASLPVDNREHKVKIYKEYFKSCSCCCEAANRGKMLARNEAYCSSKLCAVTAVNLIEISFN